MVSQTRNPSPQLRLLVSVPEAAAALGITHRSVRGLVYAGKLRSLKVGARRLIAVDELEGFVRSLRGEPAPMTVQHHRSSTSVSTRQFLHRRAR